jgi:uncharacterized protein YukE
MVESSPRAILELAKSIAQGIKTIQTLNEEMESQLKSLGATFQDEGFGAVTSYVAKSKSGIENAMPDLQTIIVKLTQFAEQLQIARSAL